MVSVEESAVKNRLLFDGDGTGDDRRLTVLAKLAFKWAQMGTSADAKEEDDAKMHARLSAQLLQIRWMDEKSKLVQKMNGIEAANYEALFGAIKEQISRAERQIAEARGDLERARKVRRNRLEYDVMAKKINEHPSRAETGRKIEEVREELGRLKAEEEQLEDKLLERKKQFYLLVHTIHQLQDLLDEEAAVSQQEGGGIQTRTADATFRDDLENEGGPVPLTSAGADEVEDAAANSTATSSQVLNTSSISSSASDLKMDTT